MKVQIELNENEIREIIAEALTKKFPGIIFRGEMLPIEVKSKRNYRSEWEQASIRISTTIIPIIPGEL